MPFKAGPTYLTREDLEREREEARVIQARWERRARIERAFGGENRWIVRLLKRIALALELPPKPPASR